MKFSSIFALAAIVFFALLCYTPISIPNNTGAGFWIIWILCLIAFFTFANAFKNAMEYEDDEMITSTKLNGRTMNIHSYERLN